MSLADSQILIRKIYCGEITLKIFCLENYSLYGTEHRKTITYSAKVWWEKTWANKLFQSFGEEDVGEFTIANISYFSELGIWLGKIGK